MTELGRFIPVSKAKNKLLALIHQLEQHQEAIALTRDGVPAAVLLSMEHFRGLVETIEILADPQSMRSLRRSLKQTERGEWRSHHEVFDEGGRGRLLIICSNPRSTAMHFTTS